jgi:hypothetical protein
MSEKPEPQAAAKPPAELFLQLINWPLYSKFPVVGDNPEAQIRDLRLHKGKFDMYCPSCKKHTTWTPVIRDNLETQMKAEKAASLNIRSDRGRFNWLTQFALRIICARITAHYADFYFEVVGPSARARIKYAIMGQKDQLEPTNLLKVGQFPSLADFQFGDFGKFKEGMNDQQRKEFVQAITTTAHGFSVAACVYYRRVFESVLNETRDEHMAKNKMDAWPEFAEARTDHRIKLLKAMLPKFLSEHLHLYSVLSLGAHQLTEEQCAQELPVLRKAIEQIFCDRVNEIRAQKQREATSRLLDQSVDRNKDR